MFFVQFIKPQYKSLRNEVVLITGAANGVGRILCLKFIERGSIVIAVDIDEIGLNETKSMILKITGKNIDIILCDVRLKKNIIDLRFQIQKLDRNVDILINNAAIFHGKRILQLSEDNLQETFSVNYYSHVYAIQEFLPQMLLNDHGHIVIVSSIAATVNSALTSDYSGSKAACFSLAESLLCELTHVYRTKAIKVTVVTPFFIKTDLFSGCYSKFPWLLSDLEPDYVADKIVKAVMKNQKHLAIGRVMYFIPFLKTLLPVNCLMALYKFSGGLGFIDKFRNIKEERRMEHYENLRHKRIKLI